MTSSVGTLRYSPKLLGSISSKWWSILDVDPMIGKYFRHLFHIGIWRCRVMQHPAWSEHVSVVRNEEPDDNHKHLWEKHAGVDIGFDYEPEVRSDGKYFWLPVRCERLLDIREELGLPRDPEFGLHLTIGNVRELP